ncbi:MAG TPA: VOC family protein [Actinomycetota bacterium]|nr:VOC family protein [Actinomycetota bacterium]
MPQITGLSHLTLTVSDVQASTKWWSDLLGIEKLFEGTEDGIEYTVNMHPSGLIMGFRAHDKGRRDDRFDETRVGLDHFALNVTSRAEMDQWVNKLDELGIEHSGVKEVEYGAVITFRDPDNLQAEFFALPGT